MAGKKEAIHTGGELGTTPLHDKLPLYPYVNVRMNGVLVTTDDGQRELGSVNLADQLSDRSNVVTSLNVERTANLSTLSCEYSLNLYDESAMYLEDLILQSMSTSASAEERAMPSLEIEYGWASGGKPVKDRHTSFQALISEYQMTFEGTSASLEISGMSIGSEELAKTGDAEYPGGNPSEAVKAICQENGWEYDDDTIVPTGEQVLDDAGDPKTFTQCGRTLQQFIDDDLCRDAVSENGEAGYRFYIEERIEGEGGDSTTRTVAHFEPAAPNIDSRYETTETSEGSDGKQSTSYGSTSVRDARAKAIRNYAYYQGRADNELLSFSPQFSYALNGYLPSETSSVDGGSNEMVECTVTSDGGSDDPDFISYVSTRNARNRKMGMDSATYIDLERATKNLWNNYSSQTCNAEASVMGDPLISMGSYVNIDVYTKYGFRHHTSGTYFIQSVSDEVSAGSFTTSMSLTKYIPVKNAPTETEEEPATGVGALVGSGFYDPVKNDGQFGIARGSYLQIAIGELGVTEANGGHAKYLSPFNRGPEQPWCAAFVSWCLDQDPEAPPADLVPRSTAVQTFLDCAKNAKKFAAKGTYVPRPGDIFIEKEPTSEVSHVGFVAEVDGAGGKFLSIEGNHGDKVAQAWRSFMSPDLTGYFILT